MSIMKQIVGTSINGWFVLDTISATNPSGRRVIRNTCRCESCKHEKVLNNGSLRKETPKCPKCGNGGISRHIYAGRKFSDSTIIGQVNHGDEGAYDNIYALSCSCGVMYKETRRNLFRGVGHHCGCSPKQEDHGMSQSSEYSSWTAMRDRCSNPKHNRWVRYGGRGITVCDEWVNSFNTFLADMGPKPDPTWSIDRIDVNGSYNKNNCIWATPRTQANNRSSNVKFKWEDKGYLTVPEILRLFAPGSPHIRRAASGVSKLLATGKSIEESVQLTRERFLDLSNYNGPTYPKKHMFHGAELTLREIVNMYANEKVVVKTNYLRLGLAAGKSVEESMGELIKKYNLVVNI